MQIVAGVTRVYTVALQTAEWGKAVRTWSGFVVTKRLFNSIEKGLCPRLQLPPEKVVRVSLFFSLGVNQESTSLFQQLLEQPPAVSGCSKPFRPIKSRTNPFTMSPTHEA